MDSPLAALKERLAEINHLGMAGTLLDWDQQVCMPPGGARARAEQKAVVSKLCHQLFTDEATARLLAAAEQQGAALDPESDDAALLRVARRDFDLATRLPAPLVAEKARVTSLAQQEWQRARAANRYHDFAPWLQRVVDLERRVAQALGYRERLYDALLDQYEPGMTSAQVDAVFGELKRETVPLAQAIFPQSNRDEQAVLRRTYPPHLQRRFAEEILAEVGYDFTRGRQDESAHPFCTHLSRDDVRITTRYDERFLSSALFGSLHEMGHALYEQGVAEELDGTPLGSGASLALHESQSRLWENLVGRSRPFWNRYFPRLQALFPAATTGVDADTFYRAINHVGPSLIRVEADEVTYNLHVILRYELENALLEERLSVAEAPDAWNARMEEYLGLTPPTDAEGILQDVHWSIGIMGYFPTYTLGNILSVQLFERARAALPNLEAEIEAGRFTSLLEWLRHHVYRHGRKLLPAELIRRVTGGPLTAGPYVHYLRGKFGALYGV